jgi:hypothetical protein
MEASFAQFPVRLGRWLLLTAVLLCPSCSGGLNTVRGKVLYDGKPIKNAVVAFHPKDDNSAAAFHPTGVTDANGVFTLSTQKDAGAPAGEYRVTVLWMEAEAGATDQPTKISQGIPARTDRLKGKYADPATSGLKAVIKSGDNEIPQFELEKVD